MKGVRSRDELSSEGGCDKCSPISSLSLGGFPGGNKSLEKLLTGPFPPCRSYKFSLPSLPFLDSLMYAQDIKRRNLLKGDSKCCKMVNSLIVVILLAGLRSGPFPCGPKGLSGLAPARVAAEGGFLPRIFLRPATIRSALCSPLSLASFGRFPSGMPLAGVSAKPLPFTHPTSRLICFLPVLGCQEEDLYQHCSTKKCPDL